MYSPRMVPKLTALLQPPPMFPPPSTCPASFAIDPAPADPAPAQPPPPEWEAALQEPTAASQLFLRARRRTRSPVRKPPRHRSSCVVMFKEHEIPMSIPGRSCSGQVDARTSRPSESRLEPLVGQRRRRGGRRRRGRGILLHSRRGLCFLTIKYFDHQILANLN